MTRSFGWFVHLPVFVVLAMILAALLAASLVSASATGSISGTSTTPSKIGGPVSALVIDPQTPDILYAGSGCLGVLKSTDGGESWRAVRIGLIADLPFPFPGGPPNAQLPVFALALDPTSPSTLYAGSVGGVYKSLDGASTWSPTVLTRAGIIELALDPTTSTTLYAGAWGAGVFKSTDAAGTWRAIGPDGAIVAALALDPDNPSTVYVGARAPGGVYKSTDGGGSWRASVPHNDVVALAVDPATPTTVYAGTYLGGVFKSTDGGGTWNAAGLSDTDIIFVLAIDPATPTTIYAGTEDGLFKSTDSGTTWAAMRTGMPNSGVGALTIDTSTPTTLYAATASGTGDADGVFKSTDGAATWHPTGLVGGNPVCGDGILGCWEACEDGNTVDGDGCDSNCTPTGCGNGVVTAGEECDDGNTSSEDGCSATCRSEFCGDAVLQGGLGEQCDDGNTLDGDGCDSNCRPTRCGNGVVTAGEQCDDGNTSSEDGCSATCRSEFCGDAVVQRGLGEQCDDGNTSNNDACRNDCQTNVCGDGYRNPSTEECDDGKWNPADGCTNACTSCGNGIITPPEACDDGNLVNGDACDATCRLAEALVGTGTPQSCTEAALDAGLASGHTLRFDCGTVPVTITTTSSKTIAADTTIDGGGRITISGGNAVTVFTVNAGVNFDARDLTIGGGRGSKGGAVYNEGTVTFTNCTLTGNSTNGSFSGGAIFNAGTATLANCTLRGNSANGWYTGNGIYNAGTLTLTNCTLSGNWAGGGDGGIVNAGAATLMNCTLSENGGAIMNVFGCGYGGCFAPPVTLTNTILAESTGRVTCRSVQGLGGPLVYLGSDRGALPAEAPEIDAAWAATGGILGSTADRPEGFIDGGHNLQWPGADCGETIPSLDPLLDPAGLQDNGGATQTIALLAGSPAIDAGDPQVCAKTPVSGVDQRGYARPGRGFVNCSIGAYEYGLPTPTPTPTPIPTATPTATPQPSGDGGGGGCTVTPDHSSEAAWWLLLPGVALAWAQRLKSSQGRLSER